MEGMHAPSYRKMTRARARARERERTNKLPLHLLALLDTTLWVFVDLVP
jgi:hypothetical protein